MRHARTRRSVPRMRIQPSSPTLRESVDELIYNEKRNEVVLVKYLD